MHCGDAERFMSSPRHGAITEFGGAVLGIVPMAYPSAPGTQLIADGVDPEGPRPTHSMIRPSRSDTVMLPLTARRGIVSGGSSSRAGHNEQAGTMR